MQKTSWATISIGLFALVVVIGLIALAFNYRSITDVNAVYPPVDSIPCNTTEGTAYHVHVLLTIFINDKQVQIPQDIGVAPSESCLYWLHTHDTTGIIHIEAPKKISPTLGTFLAIWKQVFPSLGYPAELNSNTGWQIYVNGNFYTNTISSIPLDQHNIITLVYNSPDAKPVTTYNWQAKGL